jgi:hypothetical protein
MKKTSFAPLDIQQSPITYNAEPYYKLQDFWAYEIYLPNESSNADDEQMFFALVDNNANEIILGIDFFYSEPTHEILLTYVFNHPPVLDEEACGYIVKAFLHKKILHEVSRRYKDIGYLYTGIKHWRRTPILADIDSFAV